MTETKKPTPEKFITEYIKAYKQRFGFIEFVRAIYGPGTMSKSAEYSTLMNMKGYLQGSGVRLPELVTKPVDVEAEKAAAREVDELNALVAELLAAE